MFKESFTAEPAAAHAVPLDDGRDPAVAILCGAMTEAAGDPAPLCLFLIEFQRLEAAGGRLDDPFAQPVVDKVIERLQRSLRGKMAVVFVRNHRIAVVSQEREPAPVVASRVLEFVHRPFLAQGDILQLGACIGVASAEFPAVETATRMLARAGRALDAARASGGRTFCVFDEAAELRAIERQILAADLRKALALGQLSLHYQPQVTTQTRTLIGFEALMRWKHPERGMVSPGEFIPIAEEMRLIETLGLWALQRACQDAASWPSDIGVAVNVSAHQFANGNRLVDVTRTALSEAGIAPSRLTLEITESALNSDPTAAFDTIKALQALGVSIALDDFGTGYSSLSQLRHLPLQKLKIDRSFVVDLSTDPAARAMLRAIDALGSSLSMESIVEGVETEEQADILCASGCSVLQGYLISRPMPPADIPGYLANYTARTPPL